MAEQQRESTAPRRVLFWRLFMFALLVWAGVHFALVRQVNLHPWKFAGLAMYTVRNMPAQAHVIDASHPDLPVLDIDDESQQLLVNWVEQVRYWGALSTPDEVARDVFRRRPMHHTIQIQYSSYILRGNTSRMQQYLHIHEYVRESPTLFTRRSWVHHLPVDVLADPSPPPP
jgi:hypothetical protein